MTVDEYFQLMGTVLVNLQSLEFALRAFLYNKEVGPKSANPEFEKTIYDFKEGDCVEENAFTNFDTLTELIKKYNDEIASVDKTLCTDEKIVCIRDALAHGRVASESPSTKALQKLVKYDKPKNGRVHVTHCIMLTKDWFGHQIHLVYENIKRVAKANGKT